ncbi:MAG TPA: hypothetical protein VN880_13260, partial [Solirubrobacteraceae bacterium]|nr:hypothetical protein [Solirubrobacteraceae bacterium]
DQRFGPRRTIAVAIVVLAAASAALLGVGASTEYGAMVIQLSALGAAAGSIIPVITSELMGSVDRTRSGVAAGTLNTLRQTGSAIGVALFGSLIASGLVGGLHVALAVSLALVVVIGGVASLLAGAGRRI